MKHGNVLRRLTALALSAAMAVSSAFAADPQLNKFHDGLDGNDQTTITLTVGGMPERHEKVAVMFLLDKSTSQGLRDEAAEMLDVLASKENTDILYNVVIFSGTATATGWLDVHDDASLDETKENFVNKETTSGTNMAAGVYKALGELEDLPEEYEEKYLITFSDGITYVWSEEEDGTVYCVPVEGLGANGQVENTAQNGADTWSMVYEYGESVDGGFDTFMNTIESKMSYTREEGHVQDYMSDMSLDNPITTYIYDDAKTAEVAQKYACGPEFAMYYSITAFEDLVSRFDEANVFTFTTPELTKDGSSDNEGNWDNYPWGRDMMNYLGGQEISNADAETVFADIKDEILYDFARGVVEDIIGEDFAWVGMDTVTIRTADGEVLESTASKDASEVTLGDFTVKYDAASKVITWEINTPVSMGQGVELSYKLAITDKSTGSHDTNESATLTYYSTEDTESEPIDFPVPSIDIDNGGDDKPSGGDDNDKPSGGGDNDRYEGPDLTVVKVDEDGETIEANARFRIYKEQGKKTMWYKGNQSWSEDEEDAWIFNTSVGDGSFTAYDLKPGTYYIVEISAPEGYDLAEEPLEVEVESRDVTVEFVNSGDGVVTTPTKPVPDTGR